MVSVSRVKGEASLLVFIVLQLLDVSTTLLFLNLGVEEANPLVRYSMQVTHGGLSGLLAIKLLTAPLVFFCVRSSRYSLLARVNRGYALLIVWNLIAAVAGILVH